MTTVTLTITFNTAFRIATGRAGEGGDQIIDRENPLPASSLKGVLRDAARQLLPASPTADDKWQDHPLVTEVFGGRGSRQSPWHFSDAEISAPRYKSRVRIRVGENRKVEPGAMFVGEELYAPSATATITKVRPLCAEATTLHAALLHVASRLVDGIGADRRRGLGWVSIATDAAEINAQVALLMEHIRTQGARS